MEGKLNNSLMKRPWWQLISSSQLHVTADDVKISLYIRQTADSPGGNHNNQPGAVGDLHTDTLALLTPALRGGAIAGTRPTQAGTGAASVVMAARRPAGPGAEASIHGHVSDLSAMEITALQSNGFSGKLSAALVGCSRGYISLEARLKATAENVRGNQFPPNRCET